MQSTSSFNPASRDYIISNSECKKGNFTAHKVRFLNEAVVDFSFRGACVFIGKVAIITTVALSILVFGVGVYIIVKGVSEWIRQKAIIKALNNQQNAGGSANQKPSSSQQKTQNKAEDTFKAEKSTKEETAKPIPKPETPILTASETNVENLNKHFSQYSYNKNKHTQEFSKLDTKTICELVESGKLDNESYLLSLLGHKHLECLTTLTAKNLEKMFPSPFLVNDGELKLDKIRFSHLNHDLVIPLIENGELANNDYLLKLVSEEHINKLTNVTTQTLNNIFPDLSYTFDTKKKENQKKLFSFLNNQLIDKLIRTEKLNSSERLLHLLSEKHLNAVTSISITTLDLMFKNHYDTKLPTQNEMRFSCLNEELIKKQKKKFSLKDKPYLSKLVEGYLSKKNDPATSSLIPNNIISDLKRITTGNRASWQNEFNKFPKDLICDLVNTGQLDFEPQLLKLLTEEHLKSLEQLNGKTLRALFPSSDSIEASRKKFSFLDADMIVDLVESGALKDHSDRYLFELLSVDHIGLLNTFKDLESLVYMFPCSVYSNVLKDLKKRFSYLDTDLIVDLVENGNLTNFNRRHLLQLLSETHLKAINSPKAFCSLKYMFSDGKFVELKERFNYLNIRFVVDLVERGKFEDYDHKHLLKYLTQKHFQELKFLSLDTLNAICSYSFENSDKEFRSTQLLLFPPRLICNLIESEKYFPTHILELMPQEWFKLLDFNKVPLNIIDHLFPRFDIEFFRVKYTTYGQYLPKDVHGYEGDKKYCYVPDYGLEEMSKEQQLKNKTRLEKLTPEQRKILEPKLYRKSTEKDYFYGYDVHIYYKYNNIPNYTRYTHNNFEEFIMPEYKKYFEVLGLKETATVDEIRKQYKKLAMEHHPDRIKKSEGESTENFEARKAKFSEITTAHEKLVKFLSKGKQVK